MRRWLALLAALLVVPVWAFATGSLTIPHTIFTQPNPVSTGLLDQNYSAIAAYINNREVSFGTLATRPVAGTAGRYYFATDQNGGTLYADTGTAWVQIGGAVNANIAAQFTGLTLANNGTATATFTIGVGAATSDDAVLTNRVLISNTASITKKLTAWAVGSGLGCLDTGAVATFTWYSVFVIERVDTGIVDALCSTSATAPTMPANYTKKRRVGSIRTDWSGTASIYFFTKVSNRVRWATKTTTLDVTDGATGTTAKTATLSTPNGVTTIAHININAGNTSILYVSSLAETDEAAGTGTGLGTGSAAGGITQGAGQVLTDTLSTIRYRSNANVASSITTLGYDELDE